MRSQQRNTFSCLVLLLCFSAGFPQPTQFFQTSYPLDTIFSLSGVTTAVLQNQIITGFTGSRINTSDSFPFSGYLRKTDLAANEIWFKKYSSNENFQIQAVDVWPDGDIVCGGMTSGYLASAGYPVVSRVDPNGSVVWAKRFSSFHSIFRIKVLSNGDIVVAGIRSNYPTAICILIRLDSSGNTIWTRKIFEPGLKYYPFTLYENANHEILVAGRRFDASWLGFAVTYDSAGTKLNDLLISNGQTCDILCADQDGKGGYMLVGYTSSVGSTFGFLVINTTGSLSVKRFKKYNPANKPGELRGIKYVNPNKFWLLIEPEGYGTNYYQKRTGFAAMDSSGNISGAYLYTPDSVNYEPIQFFMPSPDHFIVSGYGGTGYFISSLDTAGVSPCANFQITPAPLAPTYTVTNTIIFDTAVIVSSTQYLNVSAQNDFGFKNECGFSTSQYEDPLPNAGVQIFPVPGNDEITVVSGLIYDQYSIVALNGSLIREERLQFTERQRVNIAGLSAGFYLLVLKNAGKSLSTNKFIVFRE